jgi:galactitol-specific phosphotransferase system IIC component
MGAGQFGYIVGGFFASILLPVIILIVCNFIPAAKRNPKVVYGICAVLAVAVAFVSASGGGDVFSSIIVAVLAVAFFFWGYTRAAKKVATAK